MDASFHLLELLGTSCFSILTKYLEKNKIEKYPFELLSPLVSSAPDLTAVALFLKQAGASKQCQESFTALMIRLQDEKSAIIVHEFLEQQGQKQTSSPALAHFLQIRDAKDKEKAKEVLRNILRHSLALPHDVLTDILKCFFYTQDPLMREAVDETAEECKQGNFPIDDDMKDFFLAQYEKRYTSQKGADELLIATTLPLLVHRPCANKLAMIFQNNRQEPSVLKFLSRFCLNTLASYAA